MRTGRRAIVLSLVASLIAGLTSAAAVAYHGDSSTIGDPHPSAYDGVTEHRLDVIPTSGPPGSGCWRPFYDYPPVYETSWLFNDDFTNWVEMGTGFQCQGTFDYWYAGFGQAGVWYPVWTQIIPGVAAHDFKIIRNPANGYYDWLIDGIHVWGVWWDRTFRKPIVGLESYSDTAVVPWYTTSWIQAHWGSTWGTFSNNQDRDNPPIPVNRQCIYRYNYGTYNFAENC